MLGTKVKDIITGFEGIVTGHVRYLTGCNQCLVQPSVDEKGAMRESNWFDEQRLERVGDRKIELLNVNAGFDKPAPKR